MNSESLLQQTAVSMIRTLYPDLVLNLSLNGISLNGLSITQRSQLIAQAKREGMETGIHDLSIYLPDGQILNLEFKRPKGGAQSPDQLAIESKLKAMGHNYYLVRSVQKVFDLIAQHTSVEFRQSHFNKSIKYFTDSTGTFLFSSLSKNGETINLNQELQKLYCL